MSDAGTVGESIFVPGDNTECHTQLCHSTSMGQNIVLHILWGVSYEDQQYGASMLINGIVCHYAPYLCTVRTYTQ